MANPYETPQIDGQNCYACRFWCQLTEPKDNSYPVGKCMRFPPTIETEHVRLTRHPQTMANDWCGEWQAAEKD